MIGIPNRIFLLVLCHLFGDYVLQDDYIAAGKRSNGYIMLVHCLLYTLPFYVVFGYGWRLWFLLGTHFAIDTLKARLKLISYTADQILHYLVLGIFFI